MHELLWQNMRVDASQIVQNMRVHAGFVVCYACICKISSTTFAWQCVGSPCVYMQHLTFASARKVGKNAKEST